MVKRKKFQKPSDPAEAKRRLREIERNPQLWGVNAEALQLASNEDVVTEGQSRDNDARALRFDVFRRLLLSRSGGISVTQFDAARRLHDDLATRYRADGDNRPEVIVDGAKGSADLVTVRSLDAGKRVDVAMLAIGSVNARLLIALIEPGARTGGQVNWRYVTEQVTGEYNPVAQATMIRNATQCLADHYGEEDRKPRARAAA